MGLPPRRCKTPRNRKIGSAFGAENRRNSCLKIVVSSLLADEKAILQSHSQISLRRKI
jgi:hypothetical protein